MIKKYRIKIIAVLIILLTIASVLFTYCAIKLYSSIEALLSDLSKYVWEHKSEFQNIKINDQDIFLFLKNIYVNFELLGTTLQILFGILVLIILIISILAIRSLKLHKTKS